MGWINDWISVSDRPNLHPDIKMYQELLDQRKGGYALRRALAMIRDSFTVPSLG